MTRYLGILAVTACLSVFGQAALGDDKDATPILDKAITALGGEAKLAKSESLTFKGTGMITFNENEAAIKTKTTSTGINRQRGEFELDFNGTPMKGLTILDGAKGWRRFGEEIQDLDGEMLATSKQNAYLSVVPRSILPLKTKDFKVEAAPEEKVGDKPATVVKAIGPDSKPFTLYFDKETGLPIKLVASVRGFQGDDVKEESTFADYKDFDGIKRATKLVVKRDGSPFLTMEYSDFQVADKADANAFAEPK